MIVVKSLQSPSWVLPFRLGILSVNTDFMIQQSLCSKPAIKLHHRLNNITAACSASAGFLAAEKLSVCRLCEPE